MGASVILTGRNNGELELTKQLMDGKNHYIFPYDFSNEDAIQDIPRWLKNICEDTGPLNGLVHSAGIEITTPINSVEYSDYINVMRVNSDAAYFLSKGFVQKKCHAKPASLVFISSVSSVTGQAARSVYCASKGALTALARSLAIEFARKDIRVNCVSPGQVETEMAVKIHLKMTPEQYKAIEMSHPLGFGSPRDIAFAVAFLLAEASRWITGTNMIVDGGYSAQ
jgi:NAD(P)-dependent dehydrogenase (short-subunit alcohol dehydrogenase family)